MEERSLLFGNTYFYPTKVDSFFHINNQFFFTFHLQTVKIQNSLQFHVTSIKPLYYINQLIFLFSFSPLK